MEQVSKSDFFALTTDFDVIPFTQTEAWVTVQSAFNDKNLLFLVNLLPNPTVACVAHIKQKFGVRMLLIEAECRKTVHCKMAVLTQFYTSLQELAVDAIEIKSNLRYDAQYEIAIRQAGFLRPVGFFSVALSSYIHLDGEIKYNDNWKRNLKKADTFNLVFEAMENPTNEDVHCFLNLHTEMSVSKNVPQPFSFKMIKTLLLSPHFQLFFAKDETDERIATILIHKAHTHAGLLYAASSSKAHASAASFYLYDKLFEYLAAQQILIFDMEKLAPSTHSTNAVFLFKNGIKGEYTLVNGEWAWYKRPYLRPLMYFAKKLLWKNIEV